MGAFSIDTEEAEAGFFGFFGWVAATAFAAAIGWVVERVLDNKFGYTAPQLRLVETPKPRPTTDDFHNRFSDPIAITNTDAYIETKMRRGWGVEFGLNKHLQLVDDSTKESEAVKKAVEMANGSAMIAGNPRRKVSDGDDRSMRRVSRLYDLDFGYEDVHYVSTHFTQKGKEHKMYCVQKGDRRHLLIDEDAA